MAETMTVDEYLKAKSVKPNKYRAKKCTVDGITFDSKKEAERYKELKLFEKIGDISDLELQPAFELQPKFRAASGKMYQRIVYKADFSYIDNATGCRIYEDVKGMPTKIFKLKYKMLLYKYPDIDLRII